MKKLKPKKHSIRVKSKRPVKTKANHVKSDIKADTKAQIQSESILKKIEIGGCEFGIIDVQKNDKGELTGNLKMKLLKGSSPFGSISIVKNKRTSKISLFEEIEGNEKDELYYNVSVSEGTKIIDNIADVSIILIKN